MLRSPAVWAACAAVFAAACTPTYDWREIRVDPPGLTALLPCKPDRGVRTVSLAGTPVEVSMQGCERAGSTFAVAWADLGDPARVEPALAQWRDGAIAQLGAGAADVRTEPFSLQGATRVAGRVRARGTPPGGAPSEMRAAWFARGTQVFQLIVVGAPIPDAAAESFFSEVRLR